MAKRTRVNVDSDNANREIGMKWKSTIAPLVKIEKRFSAPFCIHAIVRRTRRNDGRI